MLWITYAFLAGLAAGFVVVGITLLRRRARRRVRSLPQGDAGLAFGDTGTMHALTARERTSFLRMAREQTRVQRERWGRDYPNSNVSSVPGRLPGIPRALRVRN